MPNWVIALGAVIVLGIGAAAWIVLLRRYAGAGPSVELDAIRTAGTLVVGTGGFAALLLAARRQQSTERTLEHQREVARATERDAAEQRLTELYTRAVDQLGNGQAPVRLGGLHALERLAQNNPDQRQTIVDVICAYLRMPYAPPDPEDAHRRYEQLRQELQVRLTAQRILAAHLQPEAAADFWADIDLNLTEAHLYQIDLSGCHVRTARFDGATFAGHAAFVRAKFTGDAGFAGAKFARHVEFRGAEFAGDVEFRGAEFAGHVEFRGAEFAGHAAFDGATFARDVEFRGVKFAKDARFTGAKFAGHAAFFGAEFGLDIWFEGAEFAGYARFTGAKFAGDTWFGETKFARDPEFDHVRVASDVRHIALPTGWTTRAAQPAEGEDDGWLYVVGDEVSSEQPTGADDGGSGRV